MKHTKSFWIGWALTGLAALPFVFGIIITVTGSAQIAAGMAHYGWPANSITMIAILEAVCLVLYLIPRTAVLGAIMFTGYLGGAIATHLRIGEHVWIQPTLGIIIWLGLYLRESRLHVLLPIRTDDFLYEREIVIDRPREAVFAYLRQLRNFINWNPFICDNPNVKFDYRGKDGDVGIIGAWDGDKKVGAGEQEITRILEGRQIDFDLRFKRPFAANNTGYFSVDDAGSGRTRVRWGMRGKTAFPMSLIGLFINCEKMCCDQFEAGLRRLKDILEKGAPQKMEKNA